MGSKRQEKALVLDIEFTTLKDEPTYAKNYGEIVEVAIVPVCLKTMRKEENLSYWSLVKPVNTKVTEYLTELTGLTEAEIMTDGKSLAEVCAEIKTQYSQYYPVIAWGDADLTVLKRNVEEQGCEFPFGETWINFKALYSMLKGRRKEYGLHGALQSEGMQFLGFQHTAVDDARNTADLFIKLFKEIQGFIKGVY